MSTEKLLREYVRELLAEEGHGGDGGAADIMAAGMGMSPYGMHFGSSEDLYKIFVQPFTDVVQTAAGKTKELSQRAQTVVKVAFESVMTTLVPILSDSYSEIFQKEKAELDKIRNEYADIYKSNWDAFKDNDVLAAAFMYAPTALLTIQFARKSPGVAAKLISTLSGGSLDGFLKKVADKFPGWNSPAGPTGLERKFAGWNSPSADSSGGPMYGPGFTESRLREAGEKKPDIGKILANKKVIAALQNSPIVKKMEQQGQAIVRHTLEQVFKQAQAVMSAKTLQDIQHKTGAKLKGLDKLAQLPQQERQKLEQTMLVTAKKSMKEFYVRNLTAQVKQAIEGGISQNSTYVNDYQNVIRKIQAL